MKAKTVIACLLVLFPLSCAHQIPFALTEKNGAFKEGTVMFVPGNYNDLEYAIIDYINGKKKQIGPLAVVPFADYKEKLTPDMQVRGPYKEGFGNSYDTVPELLDRQKVAALFEKLDADYLYVIWAPEISRRTVVNQSYGKYGVTTTATTYFDMIIYGMLFRRDEEANEVGMTDFFKSKEQTCCFLSVVTGRTAEDDQADLLKDMVDVILKEMQNNLNKK